MTESRLSPLVLQKLLFCVLTAVHGAYTTVSVPAVTGHVSLLPLPARWSLLRRAGIPYDTFSLYSLHLSSNLSLSCPDMEKCWFFFQDICSVQNASKDITTAQKSEVSYHFEVSIIEVLWAGGEIFANWKDFAEELSYGWRTEKSNACLGLKLFFLGLGWCLKVPAKFWVSDPGIETVSKSHMPTFRCSICRMTLNSMFAVFRHSTKACG